MVLLPPTAKKHSNQTRWYPLALRCRLWNRLFVCLFVKVQKKDIFWMFQLRISVKNSGDYQRCDISTVFYSVIFDLWSKWSDRSRKIDWSFRSSEIKANKVRGIFTAYPSTLPPKTIITFSKTSALENLIEKTTIPTQELSHVSAKIAPIIMQFVNSTSSILPMLDLYKVFKKN